jgi:uncharacterized damage-inducible protein DinB
MRISDALLPEFDQEMANTRKVLERCAEDKFSFKPHEKSWAMGGLATHVATLPSWIIYTIGQDSLDIAPPGAPPFKQDEIKSTKELLETFNNHVTTARTALSRADDEHLLKPWSLLMTGQTIFTMPRTAVLRTFVMNHMIHHRAQLTVYLRLNNIPVPGLYGPSADETGT